MKKQILLLTFLSILIFGTSARSKAPGTKQSVAAVDSACIPDLGTGNGNDGAGNSLNNILAGNYTLDNSGNFSSAGNITLLITSTGNNILNFNNFNLNTGDTLTVNDIVTQGPLIIKCTGIATIAGAIEIIPKNGSVGTAVDFIYNHSAAGGAGALNGPCGGAAGGNGGSVAASVANAGSTGFSIGSYSGGGVGGKKATSIGFGSNIASSGGGGGSYGTTGNTGGNGTVSNGGGAPGSIYSDANLDSIYNGSNLFGGSGGGGGGAAFTDNIDVDGGGGGGSGGGAIQISALAVDLTNGLISVVGGNGGAGSAGCGAGCAADDNPEAAAGGGGGGSGGTVFIEYVDSCTNCGTAPNIPSSSVNISGGSGGPGGSYSIQGGAGGNGGQGRFLMAQFCAFTTGINEITTIDNATVYPNPYTEAVNFNFRIEQNNAALKLYDITGRELSSTIFSGKRLTIDRGNLAAGIYIYKCISESKISYSGRIVVM